MKLIGKIIKDTRTIREAFVEKTEHKASFRDLLEECFVELCRKLDVQVPLWLEKNTKEFIKYHKTFFFKEQFMEEVEFDRMEIRIQ